MFLLQSLQILFGGNSIGFITLILQVKPLSCQLLVLVKEFHWNMDICKETIVSLVCPLQKALHSLEDKGLVLYQVVAKLGG